MKENELDNETGTNHTGKRANEPVRILTASSITGDRVVNTSGENLGKINDIMVNLDSGSIEYVIIAFGGFMGLGKKYFAVPFGDLTVNPTQKVFVVDQSRESFENRPGFDKRHWPEANFHPPLSKSYSGFMGSNTGSDH
jgi:sporulation protein YlmC with PRC-barrel domain